MAIDKTIKLGLDAEDVIKKLENIEKELQGVKKGVEDGTQEMGKLNKSTATTAKGMTTLASGIGFVAIALKALAISGIIRLFDMFYNLLQNNQTILDATNKAFETINISLKAVVQSLTKMQEDGLLQGFFDWWKENIIDLMLSPITSVIEGVGLLGTAITKLFEKEFKEAAKLALAGAKKIRDGVLIIPAAMDDLKDSTEGATTAIKNQVKDAKALADQIVELRKEVELAEAQQRFLQMTYQRDAELQRQVRDDVSKTIDERIEANNKLGEILQEQFTEEEKVSLKRLELAELELSTDEENIQLQVALINAQTEYADLQERIVGQTSEQKVNETALNDERVANLQELSDIGKTELDRQINDIEIQAEQKRILARRTISDEQELQDTLVRINKDASDKIIQIEKLEAATKRDIIANAFGDVTSLLGEESKAGKALAVAQTLINTYSAATSALAPPPLGAGPIWGIPVAIGAVAAGMANLKNILSTKLPGVSDDTSQPTPTADIPSAGGGGIGGLIPGFNDFNTPSTVPNINTVTTPDDTTQQPIQAYVVENDISNAQALQEELEIQATL